MSGSQILAILAIIGFVLAAAVLSAAETSLTSVTRARAAALREEQLQGADTLFGLLGDRERVLSPVLFLVSTTTRLRSTTTPATSSLVAPLL